MNFGMEVKLGGLPGTCNVRYHTWATPRIEAEGGVNAIAVSGGLYAVGNVASTHVYFDTKVNVLAM